MFSERSQPLAVRNDGRRSPPEPDDQWTEELVIGIEIVRLVPGDIPTPQRNDVRYAVQCFGDPSNRSRRYSKKRDYNRRPLPANEGGYRQHRRRHEYDHFKGRAAVGPPADRPDTPNMISVYEFVVFQAWKARCQDSHIMAQSCHFARNVGRRVASPSPEGRQLVIDDDDTHPLGSSARHDRRLTEHGDVILGKATISVDHAIEPSDDRCHSTCERAD